MTRVAAFRREEGSTTIVAEFTMEAIESEPFAQVSYLIWRPGRTDAIVIDPGFDPQSILDLLGRSGLRPAAILNTHGHVDHIAGNEAMKAAFPDAPLIIGRNEAHLLQDPEANLSARWVARSGVPRRIAWWRTATRSTGPDSSSRSGRSLATVPARSFLSAENSIRPSFLAVMSSLPARSAGRTLAAISSCSARASRRNYSRSRTQPAYFRGTALPRQSDASDEPIHSSGKGRASSIRNERLGDLRLTSVLRQARPSRALCGTLAGSCPENRAELARRGPAGRRGATPGRLLDGPEPP